MFLTWTALGGTFKSS